MGSIEDDENAESLRRSGCRCSDTKAQGETENSKGVYAAPVCECN